LKKTNFLFCIVFSFVFFVAGNVLAIPTIGFVDHVDHGGEISLIPTSEGCIGSDIILDTIYAYDAPINSGVDLSIVNGRLNFSTETNVFTITGSVPELGIESGVLLSGNFNSLAGWGWTIEPYLNNGEEVYNSHFEGYGIDVKNSILEEFYGLSGFDWVFTTKVSAFGNIFDEIPLGVFQASINNNPAPVPEPSTIVLMGLGLVGLAGLGRKKIRG